jgi:hypothetical protein
MALHLEPPRCQAPDNEITEGVCGVRMKLAGERHPLWQAKTYTFYCPRCEAVQFITEEHANKHCERR